MLEKNQTQRLLDIALLGCQSGEVGLARQVIEGLDQVLDNSPELEICRAMSFYVVDEFDQAMEILSKAQEKFPENQMVNTHMALVDILMEDPGAARQKLAKVIEANLDPDAVKLAQTLVDETC